MAKAKPLTIPSLIAALKKAGFATKDNVRQILKEVIDQETKPAGKIHKAITDGVADIARITMKEFKRFDKKMGKRFDNQDNRFDKQDKRFDTLEAGQQDLKRQINHLKVDTPTQKEFEQLKTKVERHHPTI